MSPPHPPICGGLSIFLWFLWTLVVLTSIALYPPIWVCVLLLLALDELQVFGKNMAEVKCPTHHLLSGGTVNPCSITGEVYFRTCQRRMNACLVISVMSDSATPWTTAHQAPRSMGLSRQEYWRGLPCPPPRDLPNSGIEPMSLVSCIGRQVLYCEVPGEAHLPKAELGKSLPAEWLFFLSICLC